MRRARWIRNRLVGLTRRTLTPLRRLREQRQPPVVTLAEVQRRLEFLLGAMFGQPMRVVAAGAADARATDVVLPASLVGADDARERYRVLAVQQGMRIVRGSRLHVPADALERDLYTLVEGASIDATLVARAPGLRPAIARLRRAELARRPAAFTQVAQQRDVERRLRVLLETDPGDAVADLPPSASADDSASVARALAEGMRREVTSRATYRPIAAVGMWDDPSAIAWGIADPPLRPPDIQIVKLYAARTPDGSDGQSPTSDADADSEMEASDGEAESASAGDGAGGMADVERKDAVDAGKGAVRYPEWIDRQGRLAPDYATVRTDFARAGDDSWARHELDAHAPLVRQIRDRFAMLRAQRLRLRAQRAGDELDLDACVDALIDAQLGRSPSDRLYEMSRETRHPIALAILVDASGSTRTALPDGRRVIDLERLALLLASEAIDALGDRHAILAFSGLGRHEVRVATVKGFDERGGETVLRRISSLEPQDNTRLGAAVRHATALLAAQPAKHRILLLLSDGRPNDVDRYQGIEAVEDSRMALMAARAHGVQPFCLTVDAEESEYLPHLFGEGGYQIIRDPTQLPGALLRLVMRLIRG